MDGRARSWRARKAGINRTRWPRDWRHWPFRSVRTIGAFRPVRSAGITRPIISIIVVIPKHGIVVDIARSRTRFTPGQRQRSNQPNSNEAVFQDSEHNCYLATLMEDNIRLMSPTNWLSAPASKIITAIATRLFGRSIVTAVKSIRVPSRRPFPATVRAG